MGATPPKTTDWSKDVDLKNTQGDLYSKGFPKRFETYYFFSIKEGDKKGVISTLKDVKEDHVKIKKFKEEHMAGNPRAKPVLEVDDYGDGPVLPVANALIAFTYDGLKAIQEGSSKNLDLTTVRDTDPAFCDGPGRPAVVKKLNDPPSTAWDEPFTRPTNSSRPTPPIHGVRKVGGSTEEKVNVLLGQLKETLQYGKVIVDVAESFEKSRIDGRTRPKEPCGKEHFGFMDHISQPLMKGIDDFEGKNPTFSMVTEPNHLIVLKDAFAQKNERPTWMYNGSFLVFRKLEQDVRGFQNLTEDFNKYGCQSKAHMGAKLMGRWETGAPIALPAYHTADSKDSQAAKLINDFPYAGDICPASAHIRKTNPRFLASDNVDQKFPGALRAKMIRNGIPYGTEYPGEPGDISKRGLLFACYQGHIEDGFEQIQATWSNSNIFPAVKTGIDPVIGQVKQSAGNNGTPKTVITTVTADGKATGDNTKEVSFQQLVTFRGGGYFFVPSVSALRDTLGQV